MAAAGVDSNPPVRVSLFPPRLILSAHPSATSLSSLRPVLAHLAAMTGGGPLRVLPRDGDPLLFSASAAVDEYLLLEVSDDMLAALTNTQPLSAPRWSVHTTTGNSSSSTAGSRHSPPSPHPALFTSLLPGTIVFCVQPPGVSWIGRQRCSAGQRSTDVRASNRHCQRNDAPHDTVSL